MQYVVVALLWLGWCALHSGLISLSAVGAARRYGGRWFHCYRIAYNLVAIATFVPVAHYAHTVHGPVLIRWQGLWFGVRWLLLTISGVLFVAGARQYDTLQFLGIRQALTGASRRGLTDTGHFETAGVLRWVRHPWYAAAVLLVWTSSATLDAGAVVTSGMLTLYLIIGTLLEERKLVIEFGDSYREYQRSVPMLIPRPRRTNH